MKKFLIGIIKYITYYFVGTAFCCGFWYLLFGRDDNGKKKLENGKEAVNA